VRDSPAFPYIEIDQNRAENAYACAQYPGMTLRDYFAGQALLGIIMNEGTQRSTHSRDSAEAYAIADAMLAARMEPKK
jgi:hypothetical protein